MLISSNAARWHTAEEVTVTDGKINVKKMLCHNYYLFSLIIEVNFGNAIAPMPAVPVTVRFALTVQIKTTSFLYLFAYRVQRKEVSANCPLSKCPTCTNCPGTRQWSSVIGLQVSKVRNCHSVNTITNHIYIPSTDYHYMSWRSVPAAYLRKKHITVIILK